MSSNAYLKSSLPLALALATLILALTTISALADGPTINIGSVPPAVSSFYGPTSAAKTGQSVATGDINGDGYQDLLIGAPYADLVPFTPDPAWTEHCLTYNAPISCTSGAVYLYLGRPGINQTFDLASYTPNVTFYVRPDRWSREEFGRSLATGDINGDGLDDIIMGVAHYGDAYWPGGALVWVGRTSITITSAISVELYGANGEPGPEGGYNLKVVAAGDSDLGGWDVASGDINNDGLDDIIIGAPGVASSPTQNTASFHPPDHRRYHFSASPSRINNGAAYVWLGRTSLTASSKRVEDLIVCLPEMTIYGRGTDNWLGTTVATGDLDGDGYDDIIVGAPGYSAYTGAVYVFYGTALNYGTCGPTYENWVVKDLNATVADISFYGNFSTPNVGTGYDVSVGNLNNDAYEDLIIAAPFGSIGTGHVYVVYGRSRAQFPPTVSLTSQADVVVAGASRSWLGGSVLAADVNNDHIDDVLIGVPEVHPDNSDLPNTENSPAAGKVHILLGGNLSGRINLSTSNNAADLTLVGVSPDDWFGRGLAVADLNQDGFNDLIVGAAAVDYAGRDDAGAAYVINLVYPQLTLTPALTQVKPDNFVSFTTTAYTWLNGSSNVTTDTTFAISPAAGGAWSGNVYQAANPGTWTVTATYNTRSVTTSITVLNSPLAAFTCGTCMTNENQALSFNGSTSSGMAPFTYSWNFGDGSSGSGATTNHTYAGDGFYTATLTVQAANGLSSTITRPVTVTNLAPVIQSVTNTGPITPGRSVTVTVTASDVPSDTLAYAFDCDDNGGFEVGPQVNNQTTCFFSSGGTFTVTTRVTDGDGGSVQATTPVTVFSLPTASFTCETCTTNENQSLSFNGSASSGTAPLTYFWNFGDGGSGSGASVNHTYSDNGFYTVALTVQDSNGLTSTVTRPVTITNLTPAIQQVTNSGPVEADDPVIITVIASDVPADSLVYGFDCDDDGIFEIGPQAGSQATCHFSSDGVFTVSIRVIDDDGGSAQSTTSVTVISNPIAIFTCGTCSTYENHPLAFDAGLSSGAAPLSYTWSFGDGTAVSGPMVTHSYADNGVYTATLTVQAVNGLSSTVTRPVTVTNLAPIIQSVTNSGPITSGNVVTITVIATDVPADPLAYAFDCDDDGLFEIGPQAGNQVSCHFSSHGTFTVRTRVTDEDGGSAQATTSVSVSAASGPSFHILLPFILN